LATCHRRRSHAHAASCTVEGLAAVAQPPTARLSVRGDQGARFTAVPAPGAPPEGWGAGNDECIRARRPNQTRGRREARTTPDKFHEKRVLVKGYVLLHFENRVRYPHEVDAQNTITRNGVWLDLDSGSPVLARRDQFHRRYVLVEGTFNARRHGHFNLFAGEIRNVGRFELVR